MLYRIFTLHPNIFQSFLSESLIARAISKNIIDVELINWRDDFGTGNYKQVDDKPFGGGSGMVLQPDPIFRALENFKAVSTTYKDSGEVFEHHRMVPNNSKFYNKAVKTGLKKATIMLTPRGFTLDQNIVSWLSGFEELNILSGRYEGFDSRISEAVDLEISVGSFVLNGGEVAAMALIESISRLVPEFVTKKTSIMHDSFSPSLNIYSENSEFIKNKKSPKNKVVEEIQESKTHVLEKNNLFSDDYWIKNILPKIEHPQYTRPEVWNNFSVPKVLLSGDHKKIQDWQRNWHST